MIGIREIKRIILLFILLAFFSHSFSQHSLKIEDGYVKTKDDVNLYYNKIGTGSKVVIIPAGMYLSEEFRLLANDKRTIVFYDQRGRGRSDKLKIKEKHGIKHEISDLEAIRNHFKHKKVSLVGWSYSGVVVSLYTTKYPQHVNRVIQICPIPPRKEPYWEQFIKTNTSRLDENDKKVIENIYEKYQDTDNTKEFIKQYYRIAHKPLFYGKVVEGKFREDFYTLENERPDKVWKFVLPNIIESLGDWDFRSKLSKVEVPVLTIHGSFDAIPIKSAYEWTKYLPQGKILIINDAGHLPWLEKQESFYKALDIFLSGNWPAGAIKVNH